ncbi:Origin recognition complex subunit 2 [Actinomortierella ambigua]|uniref:Origin recognition complex subunit 2 n=1 Tax=Actinomortierella ambigua TaxID=1343610 RepID=A0A9P6U165_9FUNG|nr:Origin recognition complex subunit 2 [Actinomortierella ambigua]
MLITYQPNDDIPVHIVCSVSKSDADKETALAKKHKNVVPPRQRRRLLLESGLTIPKRSSVVDASRRHASSTSSRDKEVTATAAGLTGEEGMDDIFLPSRAPASATSAALGSSADPATAQGDDGDDETKFKSARQVFGFQSAKKKGGVLQTILQQQQEQEAAAAAAAAEKASKAGRRAGSKKVDKAETDKYANRARVARAISRTNQVDSDHEANASSSEEEDDEEEEEEDDQHSRKRPRTEDEDMEDDDHDKALDDLNEPQKSFFEIDEMGAERYFQDVHQKSRTSNNTLSKLPVLEHADFMAALRRTTVKHARETEMLQLLYEEQFPQWYFELISGGFNLLFYGYGSKRQLLNRFALTFLTDAPVIIVNGFFPTVTVKEILNKITAGALEYTGPTGSLQEQTAFIHTYFRQPDRRVKKVYLILHNIDGPNLRSEKSQAALSYLASCPHVHLLATLDHINAALLWDAVKVARFNWIWHELTTYENYLTETSFENSIMVRRGELGARGVQFVLASLTSNGKGLFRIMAEHQIAMDRELQQLQPGQGGNGGGGAVSRNLADLGMSHHALFQKCLENFLVSNAVTFRSQLTEFRDHQIVQSRKGPDGAEMLHIPLESDVLEGILESLP